MRISMILLVSLLFGASPPRQERGPLQPEAQPEDQKTRVSAPVLYSAVALVLSTDECAAAVRFEADTPEGARYRYRYVAEWQEEVSTGAGEVFEHYARDRDTPFVVDAGSRLYVEAGSLGLEWSFSGPGKGWVYWKPEEMCVEMISVQDFDRIDLARFMR